MDVMTRRFYRTGDRVVRHASGEYIFLGRADTQIKVLGHRVELGEVEAALRQHPGVEHAVAFGWPVTDGSADGIVVFVSGESLDAGRLVELSKASLPPYAVPQQVLVVGQMPFERQWKGGPPGVAGTLRIDA
jgi:acyl-coenzyme A synthetase/AMP-(fatty) acid ligase